MRSEERAARRAKWPKWNLAVRVVLANGWADWLRWDEPIPAASLQAIVNRAPKLAQAALTYHQVKGRSQVQFLRIEVRKVGPEKNEK